MGVLKEFDHSLVFHWSFRGDLCIQDDRLHGDEIVFPVTRSQASEVVSSSVVAFLLGVIAVQRSNARDVCEYHIFFLPFLSN